MDFQSSTLEIIASVLFGLAIVHTFSVSRFDRLASRYPDGSVGENLFHLLGEVEVVFGLWAAVFLVAMVSLSGADYAVGYLEGRVEGFEVMFTEPLFVFVIMTMAATRPILELCSSLLRRLAKLLPLSDSTAFYAVALSVGSLLGSFITEPAAMTVIALVLRAHYYERGMSPRLMYATLGVLFVNVSIGGTLTNFAAPPVLMVAMPDRWDWGMLHMLGHFGWKAAVAVVVNTAVITTLFARELSSFDDKPAGTLEGADKPPCPWWLTALHVLFAAAVVVANHHPVVFVGFFLFFLGVVAVTDEYQSALKLEQGLLVAFFLGGLVVLGTYQKWWLEPLLAQLGEGAMFLGATGLTAITDNAALTYLGYVAEISDPALRYALVSGAVCGGGLTVIANAPNPAGFGILKRSFGEDGINPLGLLAAALAPTAVAMTCLWLLPSFGP